MCTEEQLRYSPEERLPFRGGSSLQERERMSLKKRPMPHHLLRNTEQHMLDMHVNNNYSIMKVIHGLYALASIYIYVHTCAQMVEKWNREG